MNQEVATLAGGCFWCTEAIFKRLKGVASVVSGYTGGSVPHPTYEQVASKTSGHAEAIQITFDPTIISYETLLDVFFHLHNPTTLNAQGNDHGPEYRSAIFYHSEEQKVIAEQIKKKIEESRIYEEKVVTEIVPASAFYPAEEYHRNFYEKYSFEPYCQVIIDPKIQKLYKEFPDLAIPN